MWKGLGHCPYGTDGHKSMEGLCDRGLVLGVGKASAFPGVGKMLFGTLPAQKVRTRIDKWDLIKLKRFVEPREQLFERRGSPDGVRVLAS